MYELFDPRHFAWRWTWWKKEKHPLAGKNGRGDDHCPAVNVSWYDAWCFAAWCGCRLPTEEEWTYGCGAGIVTSEVASGYSYSHTLGVGDTPPNPWGLFQMSGIIWEWCDGWADSERTNRILCGGFRGNFFPKGNRPSHRHAHWPRYGFLHFGFRLGTSA